MQSGALNDIEHTGEVPTVIPALVDCLELELRRIGRWEHTQPPLEAFQSNLPFKIDTMEMTQWLQWVFIPRMRRILRNGLPLPTTCAVHPLAADTLRSPDTETLLVFIARLDRLLTNRGTGLH